MDIDIRDLITHDRLLTLTCRLILPTRDDLTITIPLPKDAPDCSFFERAGMVTLTMKGNVLPVEVLDVNITTTSFGEDDSCES